MKRVSARRVPTLPAFAVTYSSSSGHFDDLTCRQDGLFLRAAICQDGECLPVVELLGRGFAECPLLFVCIPRTIEVFWTKCFVKSGLSLISFEWRGSFRSRSRVQAISESNFSFDRKDIFATLDDQAGIREHHRCFEILRATFSKCDSLTSFCIPSEVEVISEEAFKSCSSLQIVQFEVNSRLIQIDWDAFQDCSSLQSVLIPRSVRFLGRQCFEDCDCLQTLTFESNSKLSRLGRRAFAGCRSLRSLFIPDLVDTIEIEAFSVSAICEVEIAEGNRHFQVSGDFLLSFDGRFLIRYLGANSAVEIPREVEVISEEAFCGQSELSVVAFESDSKLRRIESWAFADCSSLHSICLPSFVNTLEQWSFASSPISSIQIEEGNGHFRV
jgi:hypothetical protein